MIYMPKGTKKKKVKTKKEEVIIEEETEEATEDEGIEDIKKTSIAISTMVRDRLWKLKFRKTYDVFLWELCEMYEKQTEVQ